MEVVLSKFIADTLDASRAVFHTAEEAIRFNPDFSTEDDEVDYSAGCADSFHFIDSRSIGGKLTCTPEPHAR